MGKLILCVNPGSTSTKIAVFDGEKPVFKETLSHTAEELSAFGCNNDQLEWRTQCILDALEAHDIKLEQIDAFSGRGGGQCSHVGGTYLVNELMVKEAHDEKHASHPALLSCQICYGLARRTGKPAFMTNSPATDEMRQIARVTGLKGVYRICHAHALNQKEVALRYANSIGRAYSDLRLIVCHLGGGISVTAHREGKMVDTNDILNGDGPMTPNRTGSLAAVDAVNLAFDMTDTGKTRKDVVKIIRSQGGLLSHLGTFDARKVRDRIDSGDVYAKNVYDAMAYQIAKQIGSMYVALDCQCDAIILTGGMAHDDYLCDRIELSAGRIAKIVRIPGEFEMEALASGANRVLCGKEEALEYTGIPAWNETMLYESCE